MSIMRGRKKRIVSLLSHDTREQENLNWNREFWAGISDTDKFEAAWEMVEVAWLQKGGKLSELRLERTIGLLKPPSR